MSNPAPDAVATAMPHVLSGGGDLIGLAAIGKLAFALLVIVGLILLSAWLLRRLGHTGLGGAGQPMKIIAGKAVGPKEKIVIVEVESTWLVLGVTAGGISKLHEMPAGKAPPTPLHEGDSFAKRFGAALRQNGRAGKPS